MEDRRLATLPWNYVPGFGTGFPTDFQTLQAQHGHTHSCIVAPTPAPLTYTVYICPGGHSSGQMDVITDVGILETRGEWGRIQRHGQVGWVQLRDLHPLMRFHRMGVPGERGSQCTHTKLRRAGSSNSHHVRTAQGSIVEIPDGHHVALLDEDGDWLLVAVILAGVQYTGFVRRAYVHEAQF